MNKLLTAIVATMILAGPALADDIPTFSADRPGFAYGTSPVPTGYWQVETDLANYTKLGNVSRVQTADPTIKYGITDSLDIELTTGGYIQQWSHSVGKTTTTSSYGNTTLGSKFNFLNSGDLTASVIGSATSPTAKSGISNGQFEYGVYLPLSYNLPADFTITLQPQVQVLRNANNNGHNAVYAGVINVGHSIYGDLNGFAEVYRTLPSDHFTPVQYSVDTGLSYMVTPTLQLDLGTNIGLNRDTPAMTVYTGLSYRF